MTQKDRIAERDLMWETGDMKTSPTTPLRHEDRKVLKLIKRIQQLKVQLKSADLKRTSAA